MTTLTAMMMRAAGGRTTAIGTAASHRPWRLPFSRSDRVAVYSSVTELRYVLKTATKISRIR